VIVAYKNSTAVHLRFTIAHEMSHLILHRSVQDDYPDNKELFKKVEKQADYFASCFLLLASCFLLAFLAMIFSRQVCRD